jgi:hypothetical protein
LTHGSGDCELLQQLATSLHISKHQQDGKNPGTRHKRSPNFHVRLIQNRLYLPPYPQNVRNLSETIPYTTTITTNDTTNTRLLAATISSLLLHHKHLPHSQNSRTLTTSTTIQLFLSTIPFAFASREIAHSRDTDCTRRDLHIDDLTLRPWHFASPSFSRAAGKKPTSKRLVLAMTTAGIELMPSVSPLGSWSVCDGDLNS